MIMDAVQEAMCNQTLEIAKISSLGDLIAKTEVTETDAIVIVLYHKGWHS